MKLLKGIGGLFVKLWRWIKETAWVQPLLIVGAIFAIIFSIPYFTKWVESLSNSTTNAYYSQYQISLNKSDAKEDSEADKFINNLSTFSYFETTTTYSAAKTNDDFNSFTSNYGEKFYLIFVSESCSDCQAFQPALELLEDNWGTQFADWKSEDDNEETVASSLRIHTIFADEDSDIDDDEENEYNDQTIFERFLDEHVSFFESSCSRLQDKSTTPYTRNASISDDKFKSFSLESGNASFPVPTIVLVDFTEEAFDANRAGVSEVLFGVSGSTSYEKATLLVDMWNHFDSRTTANYNNKFVPDSLKASSSN